MLQAGNHKLEGLIGTARKGKYKTILTFYHTRTHVATAKIRTSNSNDDTNYLHEVTSIYKIEIFFRRFTFADIHRKIHRPE